MPVARSLIFFGVITTLSAGAHRYVYLRAARDTALSPRVLRVVGITLSVLAFLPFSGIVASIALGPSSSRPFVFVAMLWMGAMLYILLGFGLADLVRGGLRLARRDPIDGARRAWFARVASTVVGAGTASLVGYGIPHAYGGPAVRRVRVPLAKLPRGKSGYRIVQITDVHVGPLIDGDYLARVVARINALEPDLVAITGDLVDGHVPVLAAQVGSLADLRARDGVFFVTGNHEYYSGADEWIAHLATLGIRTLRNERVTIGGEAGFDLAGVDDFRASSYGHGHGPDLPRALHGRDTSRALVLLAHQPKQAIEAKRLGVDLQISGHTHAGQLRPFDWLVRLEQPFVEGLHRVAGFSIYVSPGTGFWGPPMRVGTTSEITEIVLEHEA